MLKEQGISGEVWKNINGEKVFLFWETFFFFIIKCYIIRI
jgi:hypothetical protein